ncbi:hypothetical protein [Marinomonas ostreistagni]|uniref:Uncharacterized protein n=1 Tax=Marinomonas ostreistagni TaxID=359209 RepID=A0ABS0ZGX0_9GAMM|nr:hypothetical protein [Marinomonas ostreistagni]MBJ7552276.1 hypothetical protein [Marinomonas ostreistagni]
MKWFALIIISIVVINVYRWTDSSVNTAVILPTTQQLNEMVGREGTPKVPLRLVDAGN